MGYQGQTSAEEEVAMRYLKELKQTVMLNSH